MKKLSLIWVVILFALIGITGGLIFTRNYASGPCLGGYKTSAATTKAPQVAEPQAINIPKINVSALVEPVGQDVEGKMDVPKGVFNVGWYNLGYKPGEKGSAVMAGHLDTVTGAPAVFFYLGQLSSGDQVIVTDKNGKSLTFVVISVQTYPFNQVPLKQIFASNDKPRLNLITCIGTLDVVGRNYSNRLVVYTELKS